MSCKSCEHTDVTIDRLRARIAELEKENKVLRLKSSASLANNLCPDHRDKQKGKPCLACGIEHRDARIAELEQKLIAVLTGLEVRWPRDAAGALSAESLSLLAAACASQAKEATKT